MTLFNLFDLQDYTVNTANIKEAVGIEDRMYLKKDVDKVLLRKCECNIFDVENIEQAKYCHECGGKK